MEFENDNDDGVHYNLPAGGVEPGETLVEAVRREAREEASVDMEVGSVAFVYEYQPARTNNLYGDVHSVGTSRLLLLTHRRALLFLRLALDAFLICEVFDEREHVALVVADQVEQDFGRALGA